MGAFELTFKNTICLLEQIVTNHRNYRHPQQNINLNNFESDAHIIHNIYKPIGHFTYLFTPIYLSSV